MKIISESTFCKGREVRKQRKEILRDKGRRSRSVVFVYEPDFIVVTKKIKLRTFPFMLQ